MTIFLVARSTKDPPGNYYNSFAAAILWTENAYWGNTFVSPYRLMFMRVSEPHGRTTISLTTGRVPESVETSPSPVPCTTTGPTVST